ncbi:unnamed protein product [Didymodactylos carnosus]|uniref:Uncharacterized protein n=1 Tax=Didymodactylos carnosus TaxID=1234261 RepID=A0A8S2DMD9_9BILA|nr:unnamed protein product [Didymodactylos carnosus]CAF3729879.1 unnamed protein product [Didymodactylos carnosus]
MVTTVTVIVRQTTGLLKHLKQNDTLWLRFDVNKTGIYSLSESKSLLQVKLGEDVDDVQTRDKVAIIHNEKLYHIETKYLFFVDPCDDETVIPVKTRVLIRTLDNRQKIVLSFGFIGESPANYNHYRHLIIFDNLSATYHENMGEIHLSLARDFSCHLPHLNLSSRIFFRQYFDYILSSTKVIPTINFPINTIIRVKHAGNYHNARIIEKDCSMIKVKFFERKSQLEIWIYSGAIVIEQIDQQFYSNHKHEVSKESSIKTTTSAVANHCSLIPVVSLLNHQQLNSSSMTGVLPPCQNVTTITFSTSSSPLATLCHLSDLTDRKRKLYESIEKHTLITTRSTIITASLPLFSRHICSNLCVINAEKQLDSSDINPFSLPIQYGWKFFEIIIPNDQKSREKKYVRKNLKKNFIFRSPCGLSFFQLSEVEHYLYQTKSKLSIKYFFDDKLTTLNQYFQYNKSFILKKDLSDSVEQIKISVYNDLDQSLPIPFEYGKYRRMNDKNKPVVFNNDDMTCCGCVDNCSDRSKCACHLKTLEKAKLYKDHSFETWKKLGYSNKWIINHLGYVNQRLNQVVSSGIYECNKQCKCHQQQCTNRLVQNELFLQLQLFNSVDKGWGIRTLYDIPRGTFITYYSGELCTNKEANNRDFRYQADLDFFKQYVNKKMTANEQNESVNDDESDVNNKSQIERDKQENQQTSYKRRGPLTTEKATVIVDDSDDDNDGYTIDAKHYGCVSRFYNHSCSPNIMVQNVFIETHDIRFPWIALFAKDNIKSGEELCWDYNYEINAIPGLVIECKCRSSQCRGRLL